MRKKVSKILALIVALVMMLGCAACSNNDTPAETGNAPVETGGEPAETGGGDTAGAENWTIGSNIWGTGVPILEMMNSASLYVIDNFGCTSMGVSDDYSSDVTIQNMQKFIGAGVAGANVYCNAATALPRPVVRPHRRERTSSSPSARLRPAKVLATASTSSRPAIRNPPGPGRCRFSAPWRPR